MTDPKRLISMARDPFLPVDFLDRPERTIDAGIVHEDVETAELVDRLFDERLDRRSVGDIRLATSERFGYRRREPEARARPPAVVRHRGRKA